MALVPPAQKDGFSYAGDSLYRETSNLNRHRRATLPELKNHFNGNGTENHPAHWYEAQLLHYGLPPSKVKGTAHKRLFDAVMGGSLAVPLQIQKIEADLKKEWTKKEREVKKMLNESATTKPAVKGTKRKADQVSASTSVNVNVSLSVSRTGVIEVQATQPATKKAKAAPKTTVEDKKVTPAAEQASSTVAPQVKKQTARKTTASSTTRKDGKPTTAKQKAMATKTTAKEKQAVPTKSTKPVAKPAAKAKGATSRASKYLAHSQGENNDAPPPYSEYDPGSASGWRGPEQSISPSSPRRRIGLLNGRYDVSCDHVEANFEEYRDRLNLIATLDGNNLWLNFNFGVATGMMKVERPYEVTRDHPLTVFWRGNALPRQRYDRKLFNIDTYDRAGSLNGLYFMGEGHIRGFIRYGSEEEDNQVDLKFDAYRRPGQSMTSEISPTEAREIWASLESRESYYSDSERGSYRSDPERVPYDSHSSSSGGYY
ncbi:uncharacterized protein N7496_003130 [Penicillium cataractarum]|uniref:Uncharacterized protein n=1 Tax=Penicillium cataractarum TaxID=2100454 RepID=A0A9W9SLX6_9EURO|nr:uncharacterized protein N7496_003130 [Penicillium cataractarum]KAJ5380702.1 hypothetical protein N7496_003130 [Penicillium cataractarum]